MRNDNALLDVLNMVDEAGVAIVEGIPFGGTQGTLAATERISYIRETNYGRLWTLKPDMEHQDTAYSRVHLHPHTDLSYYDSPAGHVSAIQPQTLHSM